MASPGPRGSTLAAFNEVDMSPFGLDNSGEVFYAADRPYGLIEGTVTRDDAPPAGKAW